MKQAIYVAMLPSITIIVIIIIKGRLRESLLIYYRVIMEVLWSYHGGTLSATPLIKF